MNSQANSPPIERIRIDKWLWHARTVKTRSLAQKLILDGNVRLNGDRVAQTAAKVKPEDVLTIVLGQQIKVLRIIQLGVRRGPASEAVTLYEDLSPKLEKPNKRKFSAQFAKRDPGSGRPTKKERRQTERWRETSSNSQ